jgi:hypothetical protein
VKGDGCGQWRGQELGRVLLLLCVEVLCFAKIGTSVVRLSSFRTNLRILTEHFIFERGYVFF